MPGTDQQMKLALAQAQEYSRLVAMGVVPPIGLQTQGVAPPPQMHYIHTPGRASTEEEMIPGPASVTPQTPPSNTMNNMQAQGYSPGSSDFEMVAPENPSM